MAEKVGLRHGREANSRIRYGHLVEDYPFAPHRFQALKIQVPDMSQRQVRHRQGRMSDHPAPYPRGTIRPEHMKEKGEKRDIRKE